MDVTNDMAAGTWPPSDLDTGVPHSARVYDYWLGGRDNYEADRALGEVFLQQIPNLRDMARANRAFVTRATKYLTGQGIGQFIDIGSGIPTSPNLHETAQSILPEARVAYVDNDPIVLAHARALLSVGNPVGADRPQIAYVDADVRQPRTILDNPDLREVIDLDQPVGLMLIAILMLLSDEDQPEQIIAEFRDALPSGSYLAITSPSPDFDERTVNTVTGFARQSGMVFQPRRRAEMEGFFGDWEMVEPGLVPVMAWRPEKPPDDPEAAYYWAGIARKP